jgi:hypothetical protein
MSIDDNKTDTIQLWSTDRKNQYYIRDKTGNVPGIALSTPVFMVEGPMNGLGVEGNIAIKNLLHESNGDFVYLNDTINTINTNIANIADIAIADAKTYTDEQIAIESNIRATEDINLGNDITILKNKTTTQSYDSLTGQTTFSGRVNINGILGLGNNLSSSSAIFTTGKITGGTFAAINAVAANITTTGLITGGTFGAINALSNNITTTGLITGGTFSEINALSNNISTTGTVNCGPLNCGVLTPSSITGYSSKAVADTLYGSFSDVEMVKDRTTVITYDAPNFETVFNSIQIYDPINNVTNSYQTDVRIGLTLIKSNGRVYSDQFIGTYGTLYDSLVIQNGEAGPAVITLGVTGDVACTTVTAKNNIRIYPVGGLTPIINMSNTGLFNCASIVCSGSITCGQVIANGAILATGQTVTCGNINSSGTVTIGTGQTSTIIGSSGITTYQPPIIKYPTTINAYTFSTDYQSVGYLILASQTYNNAANQTNFTLGLQLPYGVWGISVDWRLTANDPLVAGEHLGMMNCSPNNTGAGSFHEGGSWRFTNTNNTWASGQIRNYNASTIVQALATTTSTVGGVANVPVMPYFIGYRAIGLAGGDSVNVIISARAIRIA